MKKLKLTLFLALVIATSVTFANATDGQIPIGGKPIIENVKTTTAPSLDSVITKNDEELSSQIKNYLQTFLSFFGEIGI
jgi:Skp family chaperone for outer membrane proteins